MNPTRTALASFVTASLLIALSGCEQKTPPPPGASSGQGLNNLAANPQSTYGKSAASGKKVIAGIERQQDAAANAANQITGQSASELVVGGVKFAIPEGWTGATPSSSMVQATYKIAGAGNAQCNFSVAGGDVDSNLNRWRSQITNSEGKPVEGDVTQTTASGFRVTIFKATGTYAGMGGNKQANTAFRGAIIQMPSQSVFIRLTGPADAIAAADGAWEQMVMGLTR
jgi:hypothetical protein